MEAETFIGSSQLKINIPVYTVRVYLSNLLNYDLPGKRKWPTTYAAFVKKKSKGEFQDQFWQMARLVT